MGARLRQVLARAGGGGRRGRWRREQPPLPLRRAMEEPPCRYQIENACRNLYYYARAHTPCNTQHRDNSRLLYRVQHRKQTTVHRWHFPLIADTHSSVSTNDYCICNQLYSTCNTTHTDINKFIYIYKSRIPHGPRLWRYQHSCWHLFLLERDAKSDKPSKVYVRDPRAHRTSRCTLLKERCTDLGIPRRSYNSSILPCT